MSRRRGTQHRKPRRFRLTGDETCDRCGRHLDDGPPDRPSVSVEVGPGRMMYACGWCASELLDALNGL